MGKVIFTAYRYRDDTKKGMIALSFTDQDDECLL